jgi:hypothetical protein
MAVADNVREEFTTTGTGTISLGGLTAGLVGYQTFVNGLKANSGLTPGSPLSWTEVWYTAWSEDADGNVVDVEQGKGTLTAGSPATLTRADADVVFSTSTGSPVNQRISWGAGTKYIICSLSAEALG